MNTAMSGMTCWGGVGREQSNRCAARCCPVLRGAACGVQSPVSCADPPQPRRMRGRLTRDTCRTTAASGVNTAGSEDWQASRQPMITTPANTARLSVRRKTAAAERRSPLPRWKATRLCSRHGRAVYVCWTCLGWDTYCRQATQPQGLCKRMLRGCHCCSGAGPPGWRCPGWCTLDCCRGRGNESDSCTSCAGPPRSQSASTRTQLTAAWPT
jgi:hypothetical protein